MNRSINQSVYHAFNPSINQVFIVFNVQHVCFSHFLQTRQRLGETLQRPSDLQDLTETNRSKANPRALFSLLPHLPHQSRHVEGPQRFLRRRGFAGSFTGIRRGITECGVRTQPAVQPGDTQKNPKTGKLMEIAEIHKTAGVFCKNEFY